MPNNPMPQSTANSYEQHGDEAIVALCQNGDTAAQDYLLAKYKNFVRSKVRSFFLMGADREDIIQEGMIGLYKAIRDFLPEKSVSFHSFADLCISRQIITAVKAATRQKHIPLNSYISLNKPMFDEESDRTLLDVLTDSPHENPEDMMINAERRTAIEETINGLLSDLEKDVLNSYLEDKSYQEIAEEMQRHVKSIDNALQRVRKKLEKIKEEQLEQ